MMMAHVMQLHGSLTRAEPKLFNGWNVTVASSSITVFCTHLHIRKQPKTFIAHQSALSYSSINCNIKHYFYICIHTIAMYIGEILGIETPKLYDPYIKYYCNRTMMHGNRSYIYTREVAV